MPVLIEQQFLQDTHKHTQIYSSTGFMSINYNIPEQCIKRIYPRVRDYYKMPVLNKFNLLNNLTSLD